MVVLSRNFRHDRRAQHLRACEAEQRTALVKEARSYRGSRSRTKGWGCDEACVNSAHAILYGGRQERADGDFVADGDDVRRLSSWATEIKG